MECIQRTRALFSKLCGAGAMFTSAFWKTTLLGIKAKFSDVNHISTETLQDWLDQPDPPTLVDCRPEEEFKISHMEGAQRVEFQASADDLKNSIGLNQEVGKNPKVVCYCSVGYRSSIVARELQSALKDAGVEVFNLEGSLFKWANEGRRMVDSEGQPTTFAHPYGSPWGSLLKAELHKSSL